MENGKWITSNPEDVIAEARRLRENLILVF